MKFIDGSHPFFRPLWRRIAVVVFCLGWAVVEFATLSPFWGVIFAGIGFWSAYEFFIATDGGGGTGTKDDE
jgi:hypothetical protein